MRLPDIAHACVLQGQAAALNLGAQGVRLVLLPLREVGALRGRKRLQLREAADAPVRL